MGIKKKHGVWEGLKYSGGWVGEGGGWGGGGGGGGGVVYDRGL